LKSGPVSGAVEGRVQGKPAYVFRWMGRDWEVVFGDGRAFPLPDTLGARYLERAFEQHLSSQLSLGHKCLYSAPDGRVWE
jgi:hypothetical protein